MSRLAQNGLLAHSQVLRDGIEPNLVCLGEAGDSFTAIAIHPAHMMMALTGGFHESPQKFLIGFRKLHEGLQPAW